MATTKINSNVGFEETMSDGGLQIVGQNRGNPSTDASAYIFTDKDLEEVKKIDKNKLSTLERLIAEWVNLYLSKTTPEPDLLFKELKELYDREGEGKIISQTRKPFAKFVFICIQTRENEKKIDEFYKEVKGGGLTK